MPHTSPVRQSLAGRTLCIAAFASLLAPLGACESKEGECAPTTLEFAGVAVHGAVTIAQFDDRSCTSGQLSSASASTGSSAASSGTGGGSPDVALEGVVRNDGAGRIIVDSCHPNDTCAPMESVITLSGIDLRVSIPDGTFVQMHLYSKLLPYIGCLWHVKVRNLPTWGGTPNPTSDGTFLWLAHHYTYMGDYSLPDDPYETQRELVCRNEHEGLEGYAFRFSFPDAPGADVSAPPGQTATWSVPAGEHAGEYRVRNLQARFSSGDTEYDFEYEYWIARK